MYLKIGCVIIPEINKKMKKPFVLGIFSYHISQKYVY